MKAVSAAASTLKSARNVFYSRPSKSRTAPPQSPAGGVAKSRSRVSTSSVPSRSHTPSTPPNCPATQARRRRAAQLLALNKDVRDILEEEYRDDVVQYMHKMETQTACSAASMDMQPELQWHMRACLVDFLIEVHLNFRLRPETLYLTSNIVDRYVSRRVVYKKHYQLVGCAALWIAAKFEDAKERVPTVKDLCMMCGDAYDESAFVQMEGHVLATIGWVVGHPTAEAWLRIACCGLSFEDTQTQHVARFLMEITLFYKEYVQVPPSVIASAALALAQYTLGKEYQSYEPLDPAVIEVVKLLDAHLAEHLDQVSDTLVKKYSYSYYSKASTYIIQFYLTGRRFVYEPMVPMLEEPCTPVSSMRSLSSWPSVSSLTSTPSSSYSDVSSVASSEAGDELMPVTPTTPGSSDTDPFSVLSLSSSPLPADKENMSMGQGGAYYNPVSGKMETDDDFYASSPTINYGRSALYTLNGVPSTVS